MEKIVDRCPMRVMEWSNRRCRCSVFDPLPASAFGKPRSTTDDAAVAIKMIFVVVDFLHFFFFINRTRGLKALPELFHLDIQVTYVRFSLFEQVSVSGFVWFLFN